MKALCSVSVFVVGALVLFLPGVTARTIEGRLASGDATLSGGEYKDDYTFEGRVGDKVVIDLQSTDFDPFLLVRGPDGKTLENDDFEGSAQRSRLEFTLNAAGTYRVSVTSFKKEESGAYLLELPEALTTGRGRIERGRLESGDRTLSSGEFRDEYTFEGRAGDKVVLDLRSDEFDPYLILRPPTGEQVDNDDFESSSAHARLELTLKESGTHRVLVTTFEKAQTGSYVLELPAESSESAPSARVVRETGRLEKGDPTLTSGEYLDRFTFEGVAGERIVLDLRSDDFDPYLILQPPRGGSQQDNDDHEGSSAWSQISATLEQSGTYTVSVTTYKAGLTGGYEYVLTRRSGEAEGPRLRSESGRLSEGDTVLPGGELADRFPLSVTPGNRIVLDLSSADFDPYLALRSPSGEVVDNDDHEGSSSRSRIEHTVAEAGEYTVYVTSYKKGEKGGYELSVSIEELDTTASPSRDLIVLDLGESRRGALEGGDLKLTDHGYSDVYAFEAPLGQSVAIDLRGPDFDTYLVVTTPGGREIENDDFDGDVHRSRIEIPIEEAGRYRVHVTSFESDETGDYELSVARVLPSSAPSSFVDAGSGQIYGIFVGISEYGGRASDLAYTDRDAVRVRDAMLRSTRMVADNAVLLQNAAATREAFVSAVRGIAARATARDTLVIFFSGHGGRQPRPTGFDRADPDGLDETLEFADEGLIDDDLNELLGTVRAGRQLLVLDSCFSGGFSKDVISAPGRMGLFSSEEDVTSAVAAKFRAGGYLSVFFADSLTERYADENGDGELTALEMSHYIAECYRAEVKGKSTSEDYVSTSTNLGYQKLVVDRGSIAPYDVVFRRNR
jgi:hypothetical protein